MITGGAPPSGFFKTESFTMSNKTYHVQLAGRINGVMFNEGDPVELTAADAKPLLALGLIAGDGNAIEAITAEEHQEVVLALTERIAGLQDEVSKLFDEKKALETYLEITKVENTKQKELITELSSKMTALETALSEKEKQDQPAQVAPTSEVKEPAQTEATASAPKTSKKKS